jgi:ATP-binding cassette subfamily F protein uup
VLDEPTNDLDIESLELLEATLQDYAGTVLLVSHDRRFIDNVGTQTLAVEGGGRWREYVGGYSDWLEQRVVPAPQPSPRPSPRPSPAKAGEGARRAGEGRGEVLAARPAPSKLSYKESRELEQLPAQIEALEAEQRALTERMSQPDYHREGAAQIRADGLRMDGIEVQLAAAYERWATLDARASAARPG